VELCEACSEKDDEPQCPRKHADSESDPCEWCSAAWGRKTGHYFIKVEWDIDEGEEECCGGCGKSAPPPYLKVPFHEDDDTVLNRLSDEHGWCVKNWITVPEEEVVKWIERRATPEEKAAAEEKEEEEDDAVVLTPEALKEFQAKEDLKALMRIVNEMAGKLGLKLEDINY
jgi:hypothetical protein